MTQWVRLWEDMPNDPKWRVVAKRSGRPISEVLSVFVHMMAIAGAAAERGSIEGWVDEDVAAALDMEAEHVHAIREAMQGKTLDGAHLSGWEKRQPKREDGSAERGREFRERAKADAERKRTQANAEERPEEKREDTDTTASAVVGASAPQKPRTRKNRTALSETAQPTEADIAIADEHGLLKADFRTEWRKFRDHHVAAGSLMASWPAAWSKWCGNVRTYQARAGPAPMNGHSATAPGNQPDARPSRSLHAAAISLQSRVAATIAERQSADVLAGDRGGSGADFDGQLPAS